MYDTIVFQKNVRHDVMKDPFWILDASTVSESIRKHDWIFRVEDL
jgi:hypothetical protein